MVGTVRLRSLLVLAPLALSSCYSWTEIKPTELPKLNGGTTAPGTIVSGTNRGEAIAVSVGQVERPDGRLFEVKGEFDARISQSNGERVEFDHPVRSQLEASTLTVQGENRAQTPFELDDIKKVEISQFDRTTTTILGVVGGVGLGAVMAVVVSR